MTAFNSIGEEVRGFQVIVARPEKKTNLRYPTVDGKRALQLMETMNERGRETLARTESEWCSEYLTLGEMRDIYGSLSPLR